MSAHQHRDFSRVQNLTKREIEVARLAAAGLSNKQIAETLVISLNTVDSHMNNIFSKLGISSRGELKTLEQFADNGKNPHPSPPPPETARAGEGEEAEQR